MSDDDPQPIRHAAALVAAAREILVLTGAGISAESGIPTFREAQTGLWAKFSPEDLATPEAFARHPERVWSWYQWRRALIARGGVNAGHRAIAQLGALRRVFVATQNVDGLHAAAGSRAIAELHGNIWRDRCGACDATVDHEVAEPDTQDPAYCRRCGAMMRPDVVWFGEMLPTEALQAAESALARADAVLVVGTSNRVYPAAALVDAAIESARPVIEINPRPTGVSHAVDVRIADSASSALPALVALLDEAPANG
ncbi:NAD-dependent deacylase [Salinisphaera sp. LB1]|uniref:SIR2 family NAD-dependent protein deacylase n=1 Tax=Salinisphaera sp. LB1 TaxID=2183911 RepID=UPI000D70589A|nr:NAD-dependent deacylase [Salinisphaera sp. LB1]AWN17402.1 NAD-dependent protein deacetylase of SIR2 family [Salinisphaera sp. LB1]